MRTVTAPDTATPTGRPAYAVVRALVRPVWRTVPWWALAVGAGLGLLLAGIPRLLPAPPDAWLCLNLLRAAALAFGLGLAFLLDDPARHTTAVVPTRRPVRIGLRVAFVVPFAVLWWTAALLLIPGRARPPVGAVSLEAAATALLALAAAAVAVRLTQVTEPGITLAAGLLPTALGRGPAAARPLDARRGGDRPALGRRPCPVGGAVGRRGAGGGILHRGARTSAPAAPEKRLGPARRIRSQGSNGSCRRAGERGLVRAVARRGRESTRWGSPARAGKQRFLSARR
ncbi:hypothetical protein AB0D27_29410 [Streptomyces sp. NPDC048415]|uniref:hypothetical protein n=1 Tax=Streptomyces sp. NPDC048415 TaxID=3154822 RepID=UPI0034300303